MLSGVVLAIRYISAAAADTRYSAHFAANSIRVQAVAFVAVQGRSVPAAHCQNHKVVLAFADSVELVAVHKLDAVEGSVVAAKLPAVPEGLVVPFDHFPVPAQWAVPSGLSLFLLVLYDFLPLAYATPFKKANSPKATPRMLFAFCFMFRPLYLFPVDPHVATALQTRYKHAPHSAH